MKYHKYEILSLQIISVISNFKVNLKLKLFKVKKRIHHHAIFFIRIKHKKQKQF